MLSTLLCKPETSPGRTGELWVRHTYWYHSVVLFSPPMSCFFTSLLLPFLSLAVSSPLPPSHFLSPRKMSENFQRHLEALEMEAKQTLQSLLSAPMQRITKLPLLMKEIQKRAPNDHPSHEHMKSCHKAVEKVFINCPLRTLSNLTFGKLSVQFYCIFCSLFCL